MKKLLLSLFVGFVGIISFCSASDYYLEEMDRYTSTQGGRPVEIVNNYDMVCLRSVSCFNIEEMFVSFSNPPDYGQYRAIASYDSLDGLGICTNSNIYVYNGDNNQCSYEITFYNYSGTYIDENYCVSNNLCPENTGNSASWSELVINDVVHESAPLIDITIPQEFERDYTVNENEFNMWVSGYNVDTEYIDGIITAQTVKPSSSDLNKIISELIPLFVPGLVVILFIRFVFKFIKKIF